MKVGADTFSEKHWSRVKRCVGLCRCVPSHQPACLPAHLTASDKLSEPIVNLYYSGFRGCELVSMHGGLGCGFKHGEN